VIGGFAKKASSCRIEHTQNGEETKNTICWLKKKVIADLRT
jgi:hypothetical protein